MVGKITQWKALQMVARDNGLNLSRKREWDKAVKLFKQMYPSLA